MSNIFIVSDTHFGHANILNFIVHALDCPARELLDVLAVAGLDESNIVKTCGCPHMRPFASVEEMDETLVDNWNKVVRPHDKVYHLGDVAMKKKDIATVARCHGHKRLVRGNHDIYPTKEYLPFFEDIYGVRVFDDMILSHFPLHPESLRRVNVHGHVHSNVTALHFGSEYLNVSCEVTEYRPLAIEEVRQRIRDQKAENQKRVNDNLRRMGIHPLDESDEDGYGFGV